MTRALERILKQAPGILHHIQIRKMVTEMLQHNGTNLKSHPGHYTEKLKPYGAMVHISTLDKVFFVFHFTKMIEHIVTKLLIQTIPYMDINLDN